MIRKTRNRGRRQEQRGRRRRRRGRKKRSGGCMMDCSRKKKGKEERE
jgi:hypothetical protein